MKEDALIIAGPCAVESKEQIETIAKELKDIGITHLRGGAYKPRTSPETFQGLQAEGIQLLIETGKKYEMKTVSEILSEKDLELFNNIDVIQIGTRNMHNASLIKAIGTRYKEKTILLKRGFAATKKELQGAIKHLQNTEHKGKIWVCERGIRSFDDNYSRYHLDVNMIADLALEKEALRVDRVVVDPSHAGGRSELVAPLTKAGIAAGADTVMIEVKLEGTKPKSDARQAITTQELKEIQKEIKKLS